MCKCIIPTIAIYDMKKLKNVSNFYMPAWLANEVT